MDEDLTWSLPYVRTYRTHAACRAVQGAAPRGELGEERAGGAGRHQQGPLRGQCQSVALRLITTLNNPAGGKGTASSPSFIRTLSITQIHTQVGAARDPSLLQSMEAPEDTQDIPPALQSEPQPIETTGGILDVVTRCVARPCVARCMLCFDQVCPAQAFVHRLDDMYVHCIRMRPHHFLHQVQRVRPQGLFARVRGRRARGLRAPRFRLGAYPPPARCVRGWGHVWMYACMDVWMYACLGSGGCPRLLLLPRSWLCVTRT